MKYQHSRKAKSQAQKRVQTRQACHQPAGRSAKACHQHAGQQPKTVQPHLLRVLGKIPHAIQVGDPVFPNQQPTQIIVPNPVHRPVNILRLVRGPVVVPVVRRPPQWAPAQTRRAQCPQNKGESPAGFKSMVAKVTVKARCETKSANEYQQTAQYQRGCQNPPACRRKQRQRHQQMACDQNGYQPQARSTLSNHHWPGRRRGYHLMPGAGCWGWCYRFLQRSVSWASSACPIF